MAIIKKYDEMLNPDGAGHQYQQSVTVTGTAISDTIILPPKGIHGFTFIPTGTGTIKITMSSVKNIDAGTEVWFDNDIIGGPALSAAKIGTFSAISGIKIDNASGTSTLEIITKED